MDSVIPILRDLWQRRRLVALFGVVALLIGVSMAYRPGLPPKSRSYHVGEAHLQILVDTPDSQVVDLGSDNPAAIGSRAGLIATLMVGGDVKQAIAGAARLKPQQLIAISSSSVGPTTTTAAQLKNPRAFVLKTSVVSTDVGSQLPIIQIDTQAPDPQRAADLANAAAAGLKSYLDARASSEAVPESKRLQVRSVGVAQAHDAVKGSGKFMAAVITIFVFSLLCGFMLLLLALARGWRAVEQREVGPDDLAAHRQQRPHPAPVVSITPDPIGVPRPPTAVSGGWADAPGPSRPSGVAARR